MEFEIVVVGTSLGGSMALATVLSGLQKGFPLPVAVVQHNEKDSDGRPRAALQTYCRLTVVEAEHKETIAPGRVYLAPPDCHLLVEGNRFALSTEGSVHHARPSVDVLFGSAADAYGEEVIGVILTGANPDGARGASRIRKRGGLVLVQDPTTAEDSSMPEAVIAAGAADRVLPLRKIAPILTGLCSFVPKASGCR